MSHIGARASLQSPAATHPTHVPVVMSQTVAAVPSGPVACVQSVLDVQEKAHVFELVSHTRPPSPQSPLATHWTQVFVVVLQAVAPSRFAAQSMLTLH